MYYEKVGLAYGPASGRNVQPDFPSSGLDIQPKIDEYRIVGPTSGNAGISSIFAGTITIPSNTITVQLQEGVSGLNVDTRFLVNDVSDNAYNGSFLVDTVAKQSMHQDRLQDLHIRKPATPTSAELTPASATITLDSDTVTSASPYISMYQSDLYMVCVVFMLMAVSYRFPVNGCCTVHWSITTEG